MTKRDNKRIAKNAMFLYLRMFIIMFISLYTSRLILEVLGIEDYGIYNIVGGVIVLFSFINSAMASSTQRFITYELVENHIDSIKRTFGISLSIHILIAGTIFILGETIGLWFLNNKLVIPIERLAAANWVFQFSILSCLVSVLNVPYIAIIIAYEKMTVYAVISVLDVVIKLLVIIAVSFWYNDRLIMYAILLSFISILDLLIYVKYTWKHYVVTRTFGYFEKKKFVEMISFAGWSLWGNIAYITYTQGLNVLLNLFFGPVVNATRGIAVQVESAIRNFSMSFQTALNPQITKSYAEGEYEDMFRYVFLSSKFSFFLLFIISLPIFIETKKILEIWLLEIPIYGVAFVRLVLINVILDAMMNPFITAINATGKIKLYHSVIGGLMLSILPLSYFFLNHDYPAYIVYVITIIVGGIASIIRIHIFGKLLNITSLTFIKHVCLRVVLVVIISFPVPYAFFFYSNMEPLIRLFGVFVISIMIVGISVYFIGLDAYERRCVNKIISKARK